MTTFAWLGLIFAGWFFLSGLTVVFLYACALHFQDRRERAMLDRAAVAQEWDDGELVDEWTRMIDVLSPLAFVRADEVTDD